MTDTQLNFDVIVVGAGPAGLSAAIELKRLGTGSVLVVEREKQAGGIPRHCLHSPYGMREWNRLMFGPAYARRLTQDALDAGVDIRCETTVTALKPNGVIEVSSDTGLQTLTGRAVLLAMGARETSRSARLVGGTKPKGVMNTATLQNFAAFSDHMPFKRPVIVGTEIVSFSALMTCRSHGVKPVAMLEENTRITARFPFALAPKAMCVPLHLETQIAQIHGKRQVEAVTVIGPSGSHTLQCDGVIFTGGFRPENALLRSSGFELDSGSLGPKIDQYGRLRELRYYCAGNILRGIETAGWCWNEGRKVAQCIAAGLQRDLPPRTSVDVSAQASASEHVIKFSLPQVISPSAPKAPVAFDKLQLRLSDAYTGNVVIGSSTHKISSKPERRILLPLPQSPAS
ncbi:NAD(P)/FAD-dependent oxidoreductase [Celeribacter halophilus]|uniref:Pyridine nucleotide-disulphide oxidoreductase n=1 Tax=Celeribacter halophilus TaxID=576117 RepID=A0A1I3U2J6_9RHOB|nr:FAD-dependent oxidoreductase [Celeribacter halophilus]PZX04703.1 pyridine nucleotide-disulfide oxidoreductase [Celeribacter halophilus]SFJ76973.1 Pyridine nucleotide-disulphide oxidoreductase [Celeribacter halophilus]